ncbi:MAG: BatD family protein [Labilithrix sp.]|nr:BatD family protein [Labilithrix sp.]MCW5812260.1 BatD family protein [Labilithrix sp.]
MTWLRQLAAFLAAFAVVFLAGMPRAFAQSLDVTSNVDAAEIGLGDTVVYTLQAMSRTKEQPSDPRIGQHQGFTLVDTGSSPSHMVSIVNGRASEQHGLTTQWRLRADRLGTFTIGPASVAFGNGRVSGQAQRVVVVAPGQGHARPRRPRDPFGGGSPFDPFRGIFGAPDDDDPFNAIQTDPKLSLPAERAPVAFLHATIDKQRVVVGEQVTLTVYLYEDLHQRQGRPSDVHEATANDFVKRSLMQDESRAVLVGNASIGGKVWSVKLVRKSALFPLKTGRLEIAPMSLSLPQVRVGLRESERLYVDVIEPPVEGRPAGFQLGDTGDFSLSAQVTPRSLEQHGAVGVTVELRGTGNIPATIPMPEIAGVEWLEPSTRDALGPASNDLYGGTRTFAYVARVHKEGAVDLGEIRLPYFDPRTRGYSVARAALGILSVAKSDGRDGGADVNEPVLANMPAPRAELEGRRAESFITERPVYWGALFGSPFACAIAIVLGDAVRRARERRASATPSPEKIAKDRHAEATSALKGDDGAKAAAAIARAVEADVLAKHGVNLRGTSGDAALSELTDAGMDETKAKEVLAVVAACEDARFSPSGVEIEPMRALWKRALAALVLALFVLFPAHAGAADEGDEQTDPAALFRGATQALAADKPAEAIAKLEALGDRGVVDAVISFDRGLAYAARVRLGAEQPGDLGRAAHGFEEARALTFDRRLEDDATNALASVRSEVARRRARTGDPVEIASGFSLGRSIVELLPENAWAILAAVMAAVLTGAIVARRLAELPRAKVAATTSASIAGALLVAGAVLAYAARDARLHLREGIVVAPNARLLDGKHVAIDGVAPIPEGVRARILEEHGGFSRVHLSGADGYLPSSFVLPIAKR